MSTFQMHAPANLAFETTLLVRDTCLCLPGVEVFSLDQL